MTSLDVRDMLDLPTNAGPRPSKKAKTSGPRPNLKGLQREVQSLGGDNPIAIVPQAPLFKRRRLVSKKPAAKWDLEPFRNSARKDGLVLRHWRRKEEKPAPAVENADGEIADEKEPEIKDSTFARFNVQVNVPAYDDAQYNQHLKHDEWSKEETDYLMSLVQDFDLRWPVIWDRYEFEPAIHKEEHTNGESQALVTEPKLRTMEDLKARYYDVAAKMMAVHRPVSYMSQAEFSLHQLMSSFKSDQERLRKQFAEAAMSRTAEERREEENLLIELKRITSRIDRLNEERSELYARLDAPHSNVGSSTLSHYTTSAGLSSLVQQLMSVDKTKKRKSLLGPEGVSPAPTGPSTQQRESVDRRDSIRESVSGPSGKKPSAATPTERRNLTKDEEVLFGVSNHERLTGGPHFRHDKVTKQLTAKSTVQSQKISNVLTELSIPVRLRMPTAEVVNAYEQLLGGINTLLDARKVADKLESEIKVLEALKKEREKKARIERGEATPEDEREAAAEAGEEGQDAHEEHDTEAKKEDMDGNIDMAGVEATAGVEDGDGNDESVVPSTRASSAAHKRSASVLSQVSDKSSKRQRK